MDLTTITTLAQAAEALDPAAYGETAGRAIALGIGVGLGTIGRVLALATSSARSSRRRRVSPSSLTRSAATSSCTSP